MSLFLNRWECAIYGAVLCGNSCLRDVIVVVVEGYAKQRTMCLKNGTVALL